MKYFYSIDLTLIQEYNICLDDVLIIYFINYKQNNPNAVFTTYQNESYTKINYNEFTKDLSLILKVQEKRIKQRLSLLKNKNLIKSYKMPLTNSFYYLVTQKGLNLIIKTQ